MPHQAFQKQPWLESLTGFALDGAPRLNQHTSVLASCLTTLPQPHSASTTPSSYRIPPGSYSPPGVDGVHAMLTKGQLHGRAHWRPAHDDPPQGLQAQPGLLAVQQQAGEHGGHPRRQRGFVLAYAPLDAFAVQLRPCMSCTPWVEGLKFLANSLSNACPSNPACCSGDPSWVSSFRWALVSACRVRQLCRPRHMRLWTVCSEEGKGGLGYQCLA